MGDNIQPSSSKTGHHSQPSNSRTGQTSQASSLRNGLASQPSSSRAGYPPQSARSGNPSQVTSARGGPSSQTLSSRNAFTTAKGMKTSSALGGQRTVRPVGTKLLPSKMKTFAGTEGPVKAKPSSTVGRAKANRQMDDLYDAYLINYMMNGIMADMENLATKNNMETEVEQFLGIIRTAPEMVSAYANKIVLKLWEDLKLFETISGAFDNLVDFTGEETLIEIQSILMKKFDKINVEGATIAGPLFEDAEVKQIAEMLQSNLTKLVDEHKVSGFVQVFGDALGKLTTKVLTTERINEDLVKQNKQVLEKCSLSICNIAVESYIAEKQDEDAQDDAVEQEGDRENVRPDED